MAEWSNAVDSKSIVLLSGYLGFESLSLRHLQKSPREAGFFVNDVESWGLNPRDRVRQQAKARREYRGR